MRLPRNHGVPITALAFSPSGRLAIGDKRGGLSLFEGAAQTERAVPHLGAVHALRFLDEDTLVSASEDQGVRVFRRGDIATAQLFRAHMDEVIGILPLRRGGADFLTWSNDGTLRAFALDAPRPVWELRNLDLADDWGRKDRVAIRGDRLIVFDARGTLRWYDLDESPPRELGRVGGGHFAQRMVGATARGIWRIEDGQQGPAELCFIPTVDGATPVAVPLETPVHAAVSGRLVVAITEDRRIWRCDADDPGNAPVELGSMALPIRGALSLDEHVLFAGDDGDLTLVGVDGHITEGESSLGDVSAMAVASSGAIALGFHLGHVELTGIEAIRPKKAASRLKPIWRVELDDRNFVYDMALGRAALFLGIRSINSSTNDPNSRVEQRALDDGRVLASFPTSSHESLSLAGDRLVVASRGASYLLDAADLRLVTELPEMAGPPHQVAVAGAEVWLATKKKLLVIRLSDGKIVRELDYDAANGQVYFEVGDDTIATRRNSAVTVWDRGTGKKLASRQVRGSTSRKSLAASGPAAYHREELAAKKARAALELRDWQDWRSIVSSPDGYWLYLASDYKICMWDLERDQLAWKSDAYEAPPTGRFLAGGARILTWADVRDTQTGELLLHVPGGVSAVSQDGKLLLTARQDPPNAWVIDLERGEVLGRLDGHLYHLRPLVHTPDLRLIGSSCNGQVVQLHRLLGEGE